MPRYTPTGNQDPQAEQLGQLLQLAQLNHLTTAPQQEQQNLDQTDMRNRVAAAIQLMGLRQEHEHQKATEEQARTALEETIKTRQEGQKANVMDALISHLSQRPDVPLSTLADTLEKGGHPELAGTLREVHTKEVAGKVATHLGAVHTLGGDQKKIDTYLSAIGGDPEVSAAVKAALPETATVAPTSGVSWGTRLGQLSALGQNPEAALLSGLTNVYNSAKNNQGIKDFWSALLNKPATVQ